MIVSRLHYLPGCIVGGDVVVGIVTLAWDNNWEIVN